MRVRSSHIALAILAVLAVAHTASALTCVFLHGIGQDGPGVKTNNVLKDANYVRKNLPAYWGDLDVRARKAGCLDVFMFWTNSVTRGWTDAGLQTEYCGVLAETNADVVFAHSMAGMVLAAGIQNGVTGCERIGTGADAKTHWYGLQAPLGGSIAADAMAQVCPNPLAAVVLGKGCQKSGGGFTIAASYASLQTANVPSSLKATALKHESGNLCGVITDNYAVKTDRAGDKMNSMERAATGVGLTAIRGVVSVIYKNQADWEAPNKPTAAGSAVPEHGTDGMVSLGSCRTVPLSQYKKDPAHPFYVMEGNHGDGRGTFGDDPNNAHYQPCAYVANMIKRTAALKAEAKAKKAKFVQLFDDAEADAEVDAEDEDQEQEQADEQDEDEEQTEDADEVDADADDEAEENDDADVDADAEDEVEVEDEAEVDVDAESDAESDA